MYAIIPFLAKHSHNPLRPNSHDRAALFSNRTKTRLLFTCRKKGSGSRYPHDCSGWTLLESLQKIELRSKLSDLSDDDNAANKTYESRILKG
ncbi:UNVERIFIED_CONTAM: hypothetical protein NCL1_30677 [Trichonephila clavipes]